MAIFEGTAREEAAAIIARYPTGRERSALMPLLYLAQSIEGRVSRAALQEVGALLGLTTAEVEAVASFYTMLRLRPTGTHVVSVCTNLPCALRGANDVYEAAHHATGIPHGGELSEDQLFTIHQEECLGACEFAPVVQVNAANHDRVTPERMNDIVAALREGTIPEPSRGPAVASFREASRLLAGLKSEAPSGQEVGS
jgi:NADH-quinone oxidoreductase subunit E